MINFPNNQVYESYSSDVYTTLPGNEDDIAKMGEIQVYNPISKKTEQINPVDVIKICNKAMFKIKREYPYLFTFMSRCKTMYIPVRPCEEITDTMCVDGHNNLWINIIFVYGECKMDPDRVYAILFHELMHLVLDHISRFNKQFPIEIVNGDARKTANMKSNICMDYEVNASIVEDGIVPEKLFKEMGLLYKKEYIGQTWEHILRTAGDIEFDEYVKNNRLFDEKDKKILDAVEKASKILRDKDATPEEKKRARKELKKTVDEINGVKHDNSIYNELADLSKSKLDEIGELSIDIDDVMSDIADGIDDLDNEDLSKTLSDIDKLMDDMIKNSKEIADTFGKSSSDVKKDVENARQSFKETLERINKKKMSAESKKDMIDKVKEDLEDIISDDVDKERRKREREELEKRLEEVKKEELLKTNPFNAWIKVMKNLADLYMIGLISEDTRNMLNVSIVDLTKMREVPLNKLSWDDITDLNDHLDELQKLFVPDLVELINNETILEKTEEDMQRLVDGVFEHLFKALSISIKKKLTDDSKNSVIKMAAQKLRIIGQVLKTQKKVKCSKEFEDAYKSTMTKLVDEIKKGNQKEVFKKLYNDGYITSGMVLNLTDEYKKIFDELIASGEIKY